MYLSEVMAYDPVKITLRKCGDNDNVIMKLEQGVGRTLQTNEIHLVLSPAQIKAIAGVINSYLAHKEKAPQSEVTSETVVNELPAYIVTRIA